VLIFIEELYLKNKHPTLNIERPTSN